MISEYDNLFVSVAVVFGMGSYIAYCWSDSLSGSIDATGGQIIQAADCSMVFIKPLKYTCKPPVNRGKS